MHLFLKIFKGQLIASKCLIFCSYRIMFSCDVFLYQMNLSELRSVRISRPISFHARYVDTRDMNGAIIIDDQLT